MAADPALTTVSYPEKQTASLVFTKTAAAPEKASVKGSVKYEAGQAKISLSFSGMEPAVLFGGDIAAYVVWAVGKSAAPENLGELIVSKKGASGSQTFTTPKKDFALMITGEPYYLVSRPFDLVLFSSAPKDPEKTPGTTFVFQASASIRIASRPSSPVWRVDFNSFAVREPPPPGTTIASIARQEGDFGVK